MGKKKADTLASTLTAKQLKNLPKTAGRLAREGQSKPSMTFADRRS